MKLIKILHIDTSWKILYILIRGGALVKTVVSIKTALTLLKNQKFDLILSEPQNIAILDPQATIDDKTMERLPFWKKGCKNPFDLVGCPSGNC